MEDLLYMCISIDDTFLNLVGLTYSAYNHLYVYANLDLKESMAYIILG